MASVSRQPRRSARVTTTGHRPARERAILVEPDGAGVRSASATPVPARRSLRLLLIERSPEEAASVLGVLAGAGFLSIHEKVDTAQGVRAALSRGAWDLVVADSAVPQLDALTVLAILHDTKTDVPLIVVSGTADEELAVQVMKAGATDYLSRARLARLVPVVERALKDAAERRARREAERAVREREQQALLELAAAYEATVEGWSNALDLRDRETDGHSRRVTDLTMRLARQMGVSDAECVHIRRGALLHDIGKMGIPDVILHKPAALTPDEWNIMRRHPAVAYDLLAPIDYLRPALDIPYCHHEHWDGSGYPRRLRGEEIPLAARVFAVVDIWDALRSDRPYRPAWSARQSRDYIASLSGTHLDPRVVTAFLDLLTSVDNALDTGSGTPHESERQGERILVVDDYVANVKLLQRWLRHDGYDVLTANSGRDALAVVALHPPDLVLLDIMIPAPDGLTVCRTLKANPATAGIPVIFMSGLEPGGSEADARLLADDYIAKPIDVYELKSRVRHILERTRARRP